MNVPDQLVNDTYEALATCAAVAEMNGPAFYMFCQEVQKTGKPVGDFTLTEIDRLYVGTVYRYNAMCERRQTLEVKP